jgi:hypothetical protein
MTITRIESFDAQVGDYVGDFPVYENIKNNFLKINTIEHDVGYKDGYCRINNDCLHQYMDMIVIRIKKD